MFAGETSGVRPRAAPGAAAPGSLAMADENFIVRHSARGVLSMAGRGVHSGGSVVFVAAQPLPHLGGLGGNAAAVCARPMRAAAVGCCCV
jgi:cyclophilin family peptidyl-prolyl cis-trans isomerase